MDVLTLHLRGTAYALPLTAVAEVLVLPPLHRVPAGPAGVLGLAEANGRVIAVLDLAALLAETGASEPATHLVRLAPPHDRSALAVSSPLGTGSGVPGPGHVVVGGARHLLLEPAVLLARAGGA